MSNHRRPAFGNGYRRGYLRSPAWFARRSRWFTDETARTGMVRCALCCAAGTDRTLELHHLDYHGVTETPTGWSAHEAHEDLTAMHPRCHEWVHRLIDRDKALAGLLSRRAATGQAITRLRTKITDLIDTGDST